MKIFLPSYGRFAGALFAALIAIAPGARAVTITGDTVPHLWHSFALPQNGFLGHSATSWNNSDPGTLYAEWGGFVPEKYGTWVFRAPTVGISPLTAAVLTETSGSGILTGIGNIYGLAFGMVPGPPLVFNLIVTDQSGTTHGASDTRTVAMRSGTKGVLPNMNVTLNGVPATLTASTFKLEGTIDMPTGPGGAMEPNATTDGEWLWLWTKVPAVPTYRFDFRATVGHMSLDNLAIYASPVTTSRRLPAVQTNALVNLVGEALRDQAAP